MSSRARYVFDTNVLVSALLFDRGTPAQAFYAALDRGAVLLSRDVAHEIDEVLAREKFKRYITWEEREQFLQLLIRRTALIQITQGVRECRDPKDDKFLELAVCGEASHIVTGDQDLLALDPFRGVRIVTPRQFLDSQV